MNNAAQLEEILQYTFRDSSLLTIALTHPSYATQYNISSYERLEFLGDAVLDLLIAELLYVRFPKESEGALAKRRSALVCGETLALVAQEINLGGFLYLSPGEEKSGGRYHGPNLENALEALLAALYIDGGLTAAQNFVNQYFSDLSRKMTEPPRDPKTTLQEWAQQQGYPLPTYKTIEQEGPSHAPLFTISVTINDHPPVQAQGNSKRKAERNAAQQLLELLGSKVQNGK